MSKIKKEKGDDSMEVNLVTINDVQRFCNEMIEKGMGDFRFVVDFDWKYKLLNNLRVRKDSIILK